MLSVLLLTAAPAAGAKPPAEPLPPEVDVSAVKDKLVLLTDGKGHYVAVLPSGDLYEHLYYGDGKQFFAQRVTGGGKSGTESWDRIIWEPRVNERWKGAVGFRAGVFTVQCDDRKTKMEQVAADEASKLMDGAKFYAPKWTRMAYALARDNTGKYYYVDRAREPENNKNFRLFAGPRGNLKPLKMVNVVSDSQGDIFATKSGELRLVMDRKDSRWVEKKKELKLSPLPIDDNVQMIYSELGVYSGQRLGTPCDDL